MPRAISASVNEGDKGVEKMREIKTGDIMHWLGRAYFDADSYAV